jgi:hypothetical protein
MGVGPSPTPLFGERDNSDADATQAGQRSDYQIPRTNC